MSEENTTNENPVIINFNNREYKAEDLSPEQLELAGLLNVVAFSATLAGEEEEQEEE